MKKTHVCVYVCTCIKHMFKLITWEIQNSVGLDYNHHWALILSGGTHTGKTTQPFRCLQPLEVGLPLIPEPRTSPQPATGADPSAQGAGPETGVGSPGLHLTRFPLQGATRG